MSIKEQKQYSRIRKAKVEKIRRLWLFLLKRLSEKYPELGLLDLIIFFRNIDIYGNDRLYVYYGGEKPIQPAERFSMRGYNYIETIKFAGYNIIIYRIDDDKYGYYSAVLHYDNTRR